MPAVKKAQREYADALPIVGIRKASPQTGNHYR